MGDWVILANDYSDRIQDIDAYDMEWDMAEKNIVAKSGKMVEKRCMNIFGKQLCLCQFLDFLDATPADHLCYPIKPNKKMNEHKKKKLMELEKKHIHDSEKKKKAVIKQKIKEKLMESHKKKEIKTKKLI